MQAINILYSYDRTAKNSSRISKGALQIGRQWISCWRFTVCSALVYVRIYCTASLAGMESRSHPLCARAFLPVPWYWIPSRSVRELSGAV